MGYIVQLVFSINDAKNSIFYNASILNILVDFQFASYSDGSDISPAVAAIYDSYAINDGFL